MISSVPQFNARVDAGARSALRLSRLPFAPSSFSEPNTHISTLPELFARRSNTKMRASHAEIRAIVTRLKNWSALIGPREHWCGCCLATSLHGVTKQEQYILRANRAGSEAVCCLPDWYLGSHTRRNKLVGA
jgi:hypothetical protein